MATYGETKEFQELQKKGYSKEKAREIILTNRNKGLLDKAWDTTKYVGGKIYDGADYTRKAGTNAMSSFVSSAPRIAGNITGFGAKAVDFITPDVISGGNLNKLGDYLIKEGERQSNDMKEQFGVEKGTISEGVGEFGAEVASMFTPGGALKAPKYLNQAKNMFSQAPKMLEYANKIINNKFLNNKITRGALSGTKEMAKYDIVSKGKIDTDDLKIGAGVGAAIPIGGKVINKTRQYFGNTGDKMMTTGLINPNDFTNISERLSKLHGKALNEKSISNFMYKNKIKGTKNIIQKQLQDKITKSKNELEKLFINNNTKFSNDITNNLKNTLFEKIQTYTKNVGGRLKATAGNEKITKQIQNLLGKKELDLKEINEARKIIAKNLFTKGGNFKEQATLDGWKNIWKDTSKFLDDTMPGFRKYNKDIEVAMALKDGIAKKEAREATNQMLAYMGFGATGGGISGLVDGDLKKAAKNALIGGILGVGAGKFKSKFNSTEIQTKIGSLLKKLAPKDKKVIKNFIKTNKINGFTAGFSSRLTQTIKNINNKIPISKDIVGINKLHNEKNIINNTNKNINKFYKNNTSLKKEHDKIKTNFGQKFSNNITIYKTLKEKIPNNIFKKFKEAVYAGTNPRIIFKKLGKQTKQLLEENGITGIKGHKIDSDIKHIYNRHGEKAKIGKNEIPVTDKDIQLIPKIIKSADNVKISTIKSNRGETVIIYDKIMGNKYYYLEYIPKQGKLLGPKTMYINKIKK